MASVVGKATIWRALEGMNNTLSPLSAGILSRDIGPANFNQGQFSKAIRTDPKKKLLEKPKK